MSGLTRTKTDLWQILLSVLIFATKVSGGDNDDDDPGFSYNPVLKYQPDFASSLPVQVMLTGIIFTLTCVLLIHLCFTAQYHWPLAPVNFVLQMSGVLSLLICQIATLHVVLSTTRLESQGWPYMLTYLAVDIPPLYDTDGWTTAELAAWLIMNATTSGLIQITHIQFLTLLYPSTLEKRLILSLLAPLAVVAAIMQLLPIQSNDHVVYWADAVQNVCNATLSLLFTASLIIWGFFVKRDQAWRTDGGTAAFGAGATFLALASTVLTFAYIPSKEQYDWLPGLIGAVIMWQSFLGWWWWVGSGMGVHQDGMEGVQEMLRREEKRERKRKERQVKRIERRERAKAVFRGVTDALRPGENENEGEVTEVVDENVDEDTEQPTSAARITSTSPSRRGRSATQTSPRSTATRPSDIADSSIGQWFVKWFLLIRQEHRTAARQQAAERTERMQSAYENGAGWGLGSFAMTRLDPRRPPEPEAVDSAKSASDGESEGDGHFVERRAPQQPDPAAVDQRVASSRPPSASWWGPLQRWRLKDSTAYR